MPDQETQSDPPRNRPRSRLVFWIAGGMLGLGLVVLTWALSPGPGVGSDPAESVLIAPPTASERPAATPTHAPDSAATVDPRIPHGSLVVRTGARDLCSQEAWAGVAGLMRDARPSGIVVDRDAWDRRTLQTRVGLASWFSQCVFSGGPVVIRDDAGEQLAGYDSVNGFVQGS